MTKVVLHVNKLVLLLSRTTLAQALSAKPKSLRASDDQWLIDDTSQDCRPFNIQLVFAVSSTNLTLSGVSGRICDSGSGPKFITGGTGLLSATEAAEINVTGTWNGNLAFAVQDETLDGVDVSFMLTQIGNTITGTTIETEGQQQNTGTLLGSISGDTLTLKWLTDESSPDYCQPFDVDLVFGVSNTSLTLNEASGQVCVSGPDPQAIVVIGGNAILLKQ